MTREYDIVVYGAGGFAAKYVVRHLLVEGAKFALSGRSAAAIRKNLFSIKEAERLRIMECLPGEIERVARTARVLLNCAGPYIFSGEEIVRGCIVAGTHYLDITGETFFVENVWMELDEVARGKNLFVVSCCGFDSIPADLGVERLKEEYDEDIEITSVARVKGVFLNKTTYDSLIHGLGNIGALRKLRKKSEKRVPVRKYFYNNLTGSYNVIFMGTDPTVVKKTQSIMAEHGKRRATYLAYLDVGGYYNLTLFKIFYLMIMFLSRFSLGRRLLLRFPSFFTCGMLKSTRPSEEMLKTSSFELLFFGRGLATGQVKKMVVSGPDPGYNATSTLLVQASLCLLDILDGRVPQALSGYGARTPASVFRCCDLIERLQKRGIKFEVQRET